MKHLIFSVLAVSLVGVLMIPNAFAENVPVWVKNNAGWWASDQIDDQSFLQGIQYLIKEGIMVNIIEFLILNDALERYTS